MEYETEDETVCLTASSSGSSSSTFLLFELLEGLKLRKDLMFGFEKEEEKRLGVLSANEDEELLEDGFLLEDDVEGAFFWVLRLRVRRLEYL